MSKTAKLYCPFCIINCAINIELTSEEKIIRVWPVKDDLRTKGYICSNAQLLINRSVNEKDVGIQRPLKKVNNSFVEISWEQALDEIAEKLKDNLGKPVFYADSNGTDNDFGLSYLQYFISLLGPMGYANVLSFERIELSQIEMSIIGSRVCPDLKNSQVIMEIGKNSWHSNQIAHIKTNLLDASKNKNKKLIVVDPVTTPTAEQADIHVKLKPGTDFWFLSVLLSKIWNLRGTDESYLAELGIDSKSFYYTLKTLMDFDTNKYLDNCGISADTADEVAKIISEADGFSYVGELGLTHSANPLLNFCLLLLIAIITKNINRVGGLNQYIEMSRFLRQPKSISVLNQTSTGFGYGSILSTNLHKELKFFPVVFMHRNNLTQVHPNSKKIQEHLKNAKLVISLDHVHNDSNQYADYILPVLIGSERVDIIGMPDPSNGISLVHPVVKVKGEAKSEYEICNLLYQRIFSKEPEKINLSLHNLAPQKITFDILYNLYKSQSTEVDRLLALLEYRIARNLYTSYNIDLDFSVKMAKQASTDLRDTGFFHFIHNALADNKNILKGKKITNYFKVDVRALLDKVDCSGLTAPEEYPFILAAGFRTKKRNRFNFLDNELYLEIFPDDANKLNISDKEVVKLSTKVGTLTLEARYNEKLQSGYIRVPAVYPINQLTDYESNYTTAFSPRFKINYARIDKL